MFFFVVMHYALHCVILYVLCYLVSWPQNWINSPPTTTTTLQRQKGNAQTDEWTQGHNIYHASIALHSKNCNLYIMLMVTNKKLQKNHKTWYYWAITMLWWVISPFYYQLCNKFFVSSTNFNILLILLLTESSIIHATSRTEPKTELHYLTPHSNQISGLQAPLSDFSQTASSQCISVHSHWSHVPLVSKLVYDVELYQKLSENLSIL